MVGKTYQHEPNQENVDIYQSLIPIYINLSRKLNEEYDLISEFQSTHS